MRHRRPVQLAQADWAGGLPPVPRFGTIPRSRSETGSEGDAVGLFCDDVGRSGRNVSFVFEVGANDGSWSKKWLDGLRKSVNADGKQPYVVIFAAQPRVKQRLACGQQLQLAALGWQRR